jgi:hypothetical protein
MTANTTASGGNNGKTFRSTASASITLSIDASLGVGFNGQVIQASAAGVVVFVGTGGLSLVSRPGYTQTAGQGAVMSFIIDSSSTLTIAGDGQ